MIKIDGINYYDLDEASKKIGVLRQTIANYVYVLKKEKLSPFIIKIGRTALMSQQGINFLLEEKTKNNLKKGGHLKTPINIGGIEFRSKAEACEYFEIPKTYLSHYLKVKTIIEKSEREQTQ